MCWEADIRHEVKKDRDAYQRPLDFDSIRRTRRMASAADKISSIIHAHPRRAVSSLDVSAIFELLLPWLQD